MCSWSMQDGTREGTEAGKMACETKPTLCEKADMDQCKSDTYLAVWSTAGTEASKLCKWVEGGEAGTPPVATPPACQADKKCKTKINGDGVEAVDQTRGGAGEYCCNHHWGPLCANELCCRGENCASGRCVDSSGQELTEKNPGSGRCAEAEKSANMSGDGE